MNIINYEEFKKMAEYEKFINENSDFGLLKVQVFTAYNAIPIPNTEIIISKTFGDLKVVFFRGVTDSSGIIDNISLPAPISSSASSLEAPNYTIYDLTAINVGYESIKQYAIGMFGGIKVIQYVKMTPEIILEGDNIYGN